MLTVVYPGTFDPITRGHEDICRRAARMFERVVVAVADNTNKQSLFSLHERIGMAQTALTDLSNVEVVGFSGLLIDFMHEKNAQVILRGLRAVSDFEYEFALAGMNRNLSPDVETLFLNAAEPYMFVSGSMVREIARLGGDVTPFVHPSVKFELDRRLKASTP